MKAHFAPCEGCGRHIRVSEEACPFCDASTSTSFRAQPAPAPPTKRLSRAALLVFGAASVTAAAAVSCSSESSSSTPVYGAPPDDALVGDAPGGDAAVDTHASPLDTSGADSGTDTNFPMLEAAYGGPPDTGLRDTGTADGATTPDGDAATTIDAPAPPYGIPPPPPDGG